MVMTQLMLPSLFIPVHTIIVFDNLDPPNGSIIANV
jgi:hypothetical protein